MNFDREIKEYLGMLEKLRNKNGFTQKSIDKCKAALEDKELQEECVKHIVKDIMFKIKARNKALAEARNEIKILESMMEA
ncbi:hypothetical protein [uncultured Clostridium sp.]|uniref:hypothetical protein n=1 Tax=uncultured Clostridium sp. TaxID=59620 RepID=UPI00261CBBB0|nr:hypothetical protein [uncultured Clostridium sp.]